MRRPQFSLRTLVALPLLCTAGFGLWWRWEPWYCREAGEVRSSRTDDAAGRWSRFDKDYGMYGQYSWPQDEMILEFLSEGPPCRRELVYGGGQLYGIAPPSDGVFPPRAWSGKSSLSSVAISPDCARAVTGSDSGVVEFLVLPGNTCYRSNEPDLTPVRSVDMSTGSARAVTLSQDGTLCVFDVETGDRLATVIPPGDALSAAFCEDGGAILVSSNVPSIWARRRPERWWGVFCLWELWLTAALAAAFVWCVLRDRRGLVREAA